MSESGYYPPGAEHDPRAPWNQVEPDPIDVEVEVIETYTKTVTVPVTDYTADPDYEEEYINGRMKTFPVLSYDFSECDFKGAFKEEHYTIETLLQKCKEELTKYRDTFAEKSSDWRRINEVISETEGWVQQDIEVYRT